MKRDLITLLTVLLFLGTYAHGGTPTENQGIRALPAPGKISIDGKSDDWDLSGGMFICGDCEKNREFFSYWAHLMYDQENLYLLARVKDLHPMGNKGLVGSDNGFKDDCWQVRVITNYRKPEEKVAHFTAWQGKNDVDVIDLCHGRGFNEGGLKDAQEKGAEMVLRRDEDGKGYTQEIKLPLALIAKGNVALGPDTPAVITFEMFFAPGMSVKDNFRPGVTPDRIFTFRAYDNWGTVTFAPKGKAEPNPVRLADGREFKVTMQDGKPAVDWNGLIKDPLADGFKLIKFEMPFAGRFSVHLRNRDGQVVRQLVSFRESYAGVKELKWDGLTTPMHLTPGTPVPAGDYTWHVLAHPGLDLGVRGWAANSGSVPWDSGRTANWGGDHGVPSDLATDGEVMLLGWTGAEAGKALVCTDLDGKVQWRHLRGGMGGAECVAADGGLGYVADHGKVIYRINLKSGEPSFWQGQQSPDLTVKDLLGVARCDGIEADAGKLYVSFTGSNTVVVVDGATGTVLNKLEVPGPSRLRADAQGRLLVISNHDQVLRVDPATGTSAAVIKGLGTAMGIAAADNGEIYVVTREPDNQVKVFDAAGKLLRTIGKAGGRALRGPWDALGIRHAIAVTVDAAGKVWIAESNTSPKRFAVFTAADGKLVSEFFGPAHYGASGGAINPRDPDLMVGEGCEWHLLTETGFYLARLFQGDPLEVKWPANAAPGTIVNDIPAGAGAEDFGGTFMQTRDGRVLVQAGKVAFWNLELKGLDKIQEVPGGTITITAADVEKAEEVRQKQLQEASGLQILVVTKNTPQFTSDLGSDFRGAPRLRFQKKRDSGVEVAIAYDETNLYVGWKVRDSSPWKNGADEAAYLYARGDTVDLQLGTDGKANPKRGDAVLGDLRLSIGNLKGTPTAVLYRPKSTSRKPMTFSSGVVKEYLVDYVSIASEVETKVKVGGSDYVVEAKIPLAGLGLKSLAGQTLSGDFGVTHGDQTDSDTAMRTYWNNQQTGLVSDEVFELRLEPANWARLKFE